MMTGDGGTLGLMMTAYVGKDQVVIWFPSAQNLSDEDWESILDELKSHPIPGLYQAGKRSHASLEPGRITRVVIYLTGKTVTSEEAKAALRKRNVKLVDEMGNLM